MSYSHFIHTATCTVPEYFNFDEFIVSLKEQCVREQNFIFEEFGSVESDGATEQVDCSLEDYVSQDGNVITIQHDTEESNDNSEVWDWLFDQFHQIMTSDYMKCVCSSYGNAGIETTVELCDKSGDFITLENLIELYCTTNNLTHQPLL